MPGRFLVRFAALSGFATGVLLSAAGLAVAIFVPASSGSIAAGMAELAEAVAGAESAAGTLGRDFDQSSSLLSSVSTSIRQAGRASGATRASLGHAAEAASELVSACNLTAGDLESISSRLGPVIGPTNLTAAAAHLRAAADAGEETVESMDSLSIRLTGLEALLSEVAASVDTLGSDLAATRGTLDEAGSRLSSLRIAAGKAASASFVAIAGIAAGMALVILGLQQFVLSTLLLGLRPGRGPGTRREQEAGPGRD